MITLDRRQFLSALSCSLGVYAAVQTPSTGACWLDLCSPFFITDADSGIESQLVLTSDTFAGIRGHEDAHNSTDYEIHLYDAAGKPGGNPALRINVPAMRTTVISARELIGDRKTFFGGARIRLRPQGRERMHASDLFSSAFLRWRSASTFDNVHANPDPLQWQNTESYFYSMPFPALSDYRCLFSLFNPNAEPSAGEIVMFDPRGKRMLALPYKLAPHASLLLDLNAGRLTDAQPWTGEKDGAARISSAGLIAAINERGTAKSFGYLMIRKPDQSRVSVEHPIHQGVVQSKTSTPAFDAAGQFKARNVLYTPLAFHRKRIGELTFESRFLFGAGSPIEPVQWFYPFAVDGEGRAVWSGMEDKKLAECLPRQTERGVIKLGTGESCALDFDRLSLEAGFSGGLGVAVSPDTSHTMLKIEVRIPEWNAFAWTHFRPGLRSARAYQKPAQRGGLATDYIVSGARLKKRRDSVQLDELIAVINIDDQGLEGRPVLELFGQKGFIRRLPLGAIAPFACRHLRLSDLVADEADYGMMTMRLVDEKATLLMSTVHLDYERRDLALDHGSDRFSTYIDYGCE